MVKELLPIGSIVRINNNDKYIMIINSGFSKEFAYLGIDATIGFENDNKIIKFNENDIVGICFIGYADKNINKDLFIKSVERLKG
jgi:hypothetical protein